MMRVESLKEAQRLAADLAATVRMLERLAGGERLHVVLGEDQKAGEVGLSETYLARLGADIAKGLELRVQALRGQLVEMGVEP